MSEPSAGWYGEYNAKPGAVATPGKCVIERTRSLLLSRGADTVSHGTGSLYDHLSGVEAVLRTWKRSRSVRLAGLVHSVYATDVFRGKLFGSDERSIVRDAVGPKAEHLAWLFGSTSRRDLFARLDTPAMRVPPVLDVTERRDGRTIAVSGRDAVDLLVLHVANKAWQRGGPGGGPTAWLARASRLLAVASANGATELPVFDGGAAIVNADDERRLLAAYEALLRARPGAADVETAELRAAAAAVPWTGEPFVLDAATRLVAGDAAGAARLGDAARRALRSWGCAWDTRLSYTSWCAVAGALVAGKCVPVDVCAHETYASLLSSFAERAVPSIAA